MTNLRGFQGRPAQTGFTLIELLTVIAVLGVMMAIAIPSLKDFIASQRVKSTSYEISTALLLARSEAIKRNTQVTITPLTANTWSSGWTTTATQSSTTVTLQNQAAFDGITITTTPSSLASVIFQSTGRLSTGSSVNYWQIGSSTSTRCVKLDTAGVATTKSGACS
jgi:type IV fimbrial biogenesis protein FimT